MKKQIIITLLLILSTHSYADIPSQITVDSKIINLDVNLVEALKWKGFDDLLAVWSSDFSKSSMNRIKNINASINKFNWIIIPQGSTFSFNQTIWPLSYKDGYAKDYIIKWWKIVQELGGGICQMSTTIFRAALNAGLQIVEYRNHSKAIPWYRPYWLDATVYSPNIDVKFINNTPWDLYLSTFTFETKLIALLFGKSDWRKVNIYWPFLNKTIKNYDDIKNLEDDNEAVNKLNYKKFSVAVARKVDYAEKPSSFEVFNSRY